MKKVIPLLFLGMYFLLSLAVVLASSDSVDSEPPLFSLIKTDTSANINVTVQEDSLRLTPGKGINDEMFGFQPGSKYYYENLFQIKNITDDEISLWYTLEDDMAELYEDSVFRLEAEDFPEKEWYQCSEGKEEQQPEHVITINEGEDTGGIHFYFSVPHNYELGKYQGYISIHAVGEIDDEEEPDATPTRTIVTPTPEPEEETATLNVEKFYDQNQDGEWDEDEEAIEGWAVYINDEEFFTPVELDDLEPGQYTVREEELEGWEPTTETEFTVVLEEGSEETVVFGNYQEEEIIEPEPPEVEPEPPEVEPEEPEVPPTGEMPPYIFYTAGLMLLLGGLTLGGKRYFKKNK